MRAVAIACFLSLGIVSGCSGVADKAPGAPDAAPPEPAPPVVEMREERPVAVPAAASGLQVVDLRGELATSPRPFARWAPEVAIDDANEALATRCAGGAGSLHATDRPEGENFEAWQTRVRAYVACVLGVAGRASRPLDLQVVTASRATSRLTRVEITYNAFDSFQGVPQRVPATLYLPDAAGPVPAVVIYHGHGEGRIMLTDRPGSAENVLAYRVAQDLGYVVLAPDTRSFGAFQLQAHDAYWRGLDPSVDGGFMGALARDGLQDMSLLESLPAVDSGRMGVAGLSMGAWRAIQLGVVHPSLRAVVATGLYVPFRYLFSNEHDGCQHLPALAARLSMEDLGATLSANSFFAQWGANDYFYGAHDAAGALARTRALIPSADLTEALTDELNPGVGHQFIAESIERYLTAKLGRGAWAPGG
ncbi:MAG: acetylxylan esterase [Myxococcales bacterium]|nr:acetylxylan esterase [Myxococcales bacterium]